MNLNELNDKVIEWAGDKGILSSGTPAAQYQKTVEEVGELGRALIEETEAKLEIAKFPHTAQETSHVLTAAHLEIKDAIGDVIVTLIIQCHLQGVTLQECLQQAYDEIAERKGEMVNGVFVREK